MSAEHHKPYGYGSLKRPRRSQKTRSKYSSYRGQQPSNSLSGLSEEPPIKITHSTSSLPQIYKDLNNHEMSKSHSTSISIAGTPSDQNHNHPEIRAGSSTTPTGNNSTNSNDSNARAIQHIKTIIGELIDPHDTKLYEVPKSQISIKSIKKNGKTLKLDPSVLMLNISRPDEYIYCTDRERIIEPLVIHKFQHLNQIFFCDSGNCILLLLKKLLGYIVINHLTDHSDLFSYCRRNNWPMHTTQVSESFINDTITQVDNERFSGLGNTHSITTKEDSGSSSTDYKFKKSDNIVPSISPSNMYNESKSILELNMIPNKLGLPATYARTRSERVRTRSAASNDNNDNNNNFDLNLSSIGSPKRTRNSSSTTSTANEEALVPLETPAPFSPPLEFRFADGKPFTIAYKDFKTLYNNDWVNDNIIDFFINYEIEQTISKGVLESSEVYTFNSFFYLKLMSKKTQNSLEEIDYYGNIKRWLTKIDLFSYSNVIVPINENLHWYGCIMVGLPEFLEKARKEGRYIRKEGEEEREGELEAEAEKKDVKKDDNRESLDSPHNNIDELLIDTTELSKKPNTLKFPGKINIFVFDSLSQKHAGLHKPFKRFLVEYCRENHNIDMDSKDIVFRSTRVPKQNNFNDCGIHVIYNIRKFLNSRNDCLKIWDRNESSYKNFFNSSERSGMRRELINTLLDLHKKQQNSTSKTNGLNKDSNGNHTNGSDNKNGLNGKVLEGNLKPNNRTSLKVEDSKDGLNEQLKDKGDGNGDTPESSDNEVELLEFKVTNPVKVNSYLSRGRNPSRHLQVTIPTKRATPTFDESSIFDLSSPQKPASRPEGKPKQQEQPKSLSKPSSPQTLNNQASKSQVIHIDSNDHNPEIDKLGMIIDGVPAIDLNQVSQRSNSEDFDHNSVFKESIELINWLKKNGHGDRLKNKYLSRTDSISSGISKTSVIMLNELFPEPRKAFTNEQLNEIIQLKKLINDANLKANNKTLMIAYLKFKKRYKELPGPNEEVFKIKHDQGVIRSPEFNSTNTNNSTNTSNSIKSPDSIKSLNSIKSPNSTKSPNNTKSPQSSNSTESPKIKRSPSKYSSTLKPKAPVELIELDLIEDSNRTPNDGEDTDQTIHRARAASSSSLSEIEEDTLAQVSGLMDGNELKSPKSQGNSQPQKNSKRIRSPLPKRRRVSK